MSFAMKCIASLSGPVSKEETMKVINIKMLISIVGVAFAIPFFSIALVVAAQAARLAHDSKESIFLLCIACAAALISVINGVGRRTVACSQESSNRQAIDDRRGKSGAAEVHIGI
jgi:hypothetical protein